MYLLTQYNAVYEVTMNSSNRNARGNAVMEFNRNKNVVIIIMQISD